MPFKDSGSDRRCMKRFMRSCERPLQSSCSVHCSVHMHTLPSLCTYNVYTYNIYAQTLLYKHMCCAEHIALHSKSGRAAACQLCIAEADALLQASIHALGFSRRCKCFRDAVSDPYHCCFQASQLITQQRDLCWQGRE